MAPYFYHYPLNLQQEQVTLDVDTSRHCIQVLRMEQGEEMLLTDGKGRKAHAVITVPDRKRCIVTVKSYKEVPPRPVQLSLAIAFTKNNSRNEWLLEKATEMGIDHIYPLICMRSEKEKLNTDRLKGIMVAAMLQSQQCFLPQLHEPASLKKFITSRGEEQKLIAHCAETETRNALLMQMLPKKNTLILIGPEGDFTSDEIALSLENGFTPISLGANRLRTETAGLYVCTVFNVLNYA